MNTTEILTAVHRAFDVVGGPASVPEILHECGLGIRPAIVDKALDDAVLEGKLMRKRVEGVLRYLPAPTKSEPAPAAVTPPPTSHTKPRKARARPVPLPILDLAAIGKPTMRPRVELRNPAERNGGRRWDYLLNHIDQLGAPAVVDGEQLLPTLHLPPAYGKALQAYVRSANKTRAPRQYRVAVGADTCVLQRLA